MKIKYYLRGLGTGIVVAAILMALVASGKKSMSDEEVKARALQLGMVVADNTLAGKNSQQESQETQESPSEETQETKKSQETQESPSEETQEIKESQETQVTQESSSEETQESQESQEMRESQETQESPSEETQETQDSSSEETQESQESQTPQAGSVTIVIRSGYSSNTVAKLLAEAGLVESATKYDAFLCANGYDKKISVGTFEIPFGSSEEEIARIITGRK